MTPLSKALVGTVAAGAMAASTATPALARDNHNGIDTGDVIAGALIIGGIAAVAAAASDNNRDSYRYRGDNYRYNRNGSRYGYRDISPRQAVQQCVRAAENSATRYSYGRADVTDIRKVRETRRGYEVRGRIAVNARGNAWRRGDSRYGRGWNGDYRGWNSRLRGYDSGSFKCKVEYGRVADLDFSGIRGLR